MSRIQEDNKIDTMTASLVSQIPTEIEQDDGLAQMTAQIIKHSREDLIKRMLQYRRSTYNQTFTGRTLNGGSINETDYTSSIVSPVALICQLEILSNYHL